MTIAATHQDEVQTVTTSAPAIVAVQLMTTSAADGVTVDGNFAIHFPEIQSIFITASAEVTAGQFSLTYTSVAADAGGSLVSTAETTACLDWNAAAEDVRH